MMSSLLQIGLLVISLSVTAGTGTDPYTEKRSESSVDVRLTLLSFSNLQDRKADGSRCDPQFFWTNLCDHLFKFCLKTPSSSECNLFETVKAGSGIASPTINFENIELSEGHETSHQNVDWKNAVLTLTVDDEDGILGATENIDEFEYELIVWPLRSEEIRIEGKKLSESTLDTELMTKCSEYYYGEDCDVYCKPDKTTHTCNSTTGQRICSNGTDCRVWIPAATSRPTPETVQHTFDGDCSESVYIDPPVFANGTAHEAVTWITELKPTRELNITKCRNGDSYQYVINLISTDKNADLFIRIVKLSTPSCQSSNITISDVTGVLFSSSPDNCSKVIDSTPRIELTSASEKMRVVLSFSDIESLMKMQISTQTFAVDTTNKHYKKNLVQWHKPEIYTVGRNFTVPSFIIKLLNTTAKTEATTTTVKTSTTTATTTQPATTESRFKTFTESQFVRPDRNFTRELDKVYFVGSWKLTLEMYFEKEYTEKGYQVRSSQCVHVGEFLFKCEVETEKLRTKRSIVKYVGEVKIRARREIDLNKLKDLHNLVKNTTSDKDVIKNGLDNSTTSVILGKLYRTTVVRLGKGEQYAKVMLELPNHQIKMTLPPGEHNYEISSREQEERCYHKFMIYAWTGVIRSIQLQAEYQFDCTSLTSIAYSIIDASLLQHTKNLQRLCPGCHASQNQTLPVVKCLSNRLVVTWSTDLDQQQPFGDNPMKGLRRALLNYQESFPISTILQLTILSTSPRVVSPMKDKSGLYITPVITASCLKNGQIYDSVNQICLQRLNHRPQAPSSELARY